MNNEKIVYVCGPLTELSDEQIEEAKRFYEQIADLCKEVTDKRAFVPHEHYDPVKHASFSPQEVDEAERHQVCECTSFLIVVTSFGPSWGGGIEVEMANKSEVPMIIMGRCGKKISRLLLGNPAAWEVVRYETEKEALALLRPILEKTLSLSRFLAH